ncbi:MAG: hypothetical protein L6V88_10650 [Anaerotruncus sp.]|nr:MAG: hypothetical protein L6V88_10650 [Anaerotruncus sp.]
MPIKNRACDSAYDNAFEIRHFFIDHACAENENRTEQKKFESSPTAPLPLAIR